MAQKRCAEAALSHRRHSNWWRRAARILPMQIGFDECVRSGRCRVHCSDRVYPVPIMPPRIVSTFHHYHDTYSLDTRNANNTSLRRQKRAHTMAGGKNRQCLFCFFMCMHNWIDFCVDLLCCCWLGERPCVRACIVCVAARTFFSRPFLPDYK